MEEMTEKELITVLIDKYTDLQRIKKANNNVENEELEYQIRATTAKLRFFSFTLIRATTQPIPVRYILVSRLIGVYLMGLMYSAAVLIPTAIVYWIYAPLTVAGIVSPLLFMVSVSGIVMLLSCLLVRQIGHRDGTILPMAVDGVQQGFQHMKMAFGAVGQGSFHTGLGCLAQLPQKVAQALKVQSFFGFGRHRIPPFREYLTAVNN